MNLTRLTASRSIHAGRVFVADRGNERVHVSDRDGTYLDSWRQFGRVSGIHIYRGRDLLYATDSNVPSDPIWVSVLRVLWTGSVVGFIPDPEQGTGGAKSRGRPRGQHHRPEVRMGLAL